MFLFHFLFIVYYYYYYYYYYYWSSAATFPRRESPDPLIISLYVGLDSSRVLILWSGILMSTWNCPENMSQQIIVLRILVWRPAVFLTWTEHLHSGMKGTASGKLMGGTASGKLMGGMASGKLMGGTASGKNFGATKSGKNMAGTKSGKNMDATKSGKNMDATKSRIAPPSPAAGSRRAAGGNQPGRGIQRD